MASFQNLTINDTGFLRLPVGITSQRPSSPSAGMMRYNSDFDTIDYYDGNDWSLNKLYGKRYVGYYDDDVNFFNTAQLHGDTNLTASISSFSSSAELYSWMWKGYFLAPNTGTYTFYTTSDDASHLWIGAIAKTGYTTSNATVNNGGLHGARERSGTISLSAGTAYPMRIMFGENTGGDIMTVAFAGPSISKTTNGSGYYFGGEQVWELF